jgi:REP element-mobilizing transposase RayT
MSAGRRNPRLRGYDYATPGVYFVTVCTARRRCLLGTPAGGEVRLTAVAHLAHACWLATPLRFPGVTVDPLVVMPDHVHGLVLLDGRASLVQVVQAFKAAATRHARALAGIERPVWQRSFYDRVVRSERELSAIRDYMRDNPAALSERLGTWT